VPTPRAALPEGSVLLHIGPHKTGTTAIQGALAAAREVLAEHGVTYPGHAGAHHSEARALRRHPAGWANDTEPLPDQRVWRRFTRAVSQAPGRVVVSSELFAQSDAAERAQVVEGLGRDRLQLLVAARNPGSIAISTWQQVLRDGKTGRLDDWLEQRFRREAPALTSAGFWSWADAATLVDLWSEVIDLDRIHVIVIDESDRTLLASTFEQLLGLPEGLLASHMRPAGNRGLTAPEAELLRQVIALARDQLTWAEFTLLIRGGFVRRLQTVRTPPPSDPRPALPQWAAAQAAEEADAIIGRLRVSGAHIIGDLENLRRVPAASVSPPLDQIPTEMAAEAVTGVITAALRGMARAQRQAAGQVPGQASRAKQTPAVRPVGEVPTRELAGILARRVPSGIRRRIRGQARRNG